MAQPKGGTLAAYQGFPVLEATLRRSTGVEPDGCTVTMALSAFPEGFDFSTPPRGKLGDPGDPAGAVPSVDVIRGGRADVPPERKSFHAMGTFVAAEAVDAEAWSVVLPGLYVHSIEVTKRSPRGASIVTLALSDVRSLWGYGYLPRWTFNKLKGDGTHHEDTLDDGKPWTLARMLEVAIVPNLLGRPRLAHVPEKWKNVIVSFDFGGPIPTVEAVRQIIDHFKGRISLHWDRSVGFYRDGEGKVGHSPGNDPSNAAALPDAKTADGDVLTREYGYPPEFVIVTGGPRVQTVALDCCDPVLVIEGIIWHLAAGLHYLLHGDPRDGISREITDLRARMARFQREGRAHDPANDRLLAGLEAKLAELNAKDPQEATPEEMAEIRRFVLKPSSVQGTYAYTDRAMQILREQAFRLWRIPGAETWARHLLPLRARAETDRAGHSLPVTVETFRWRIRQTSIRKKPRGSGVTTEGAPETQEERDLRQAESELARIRRLIQSVSGNATFDLDAGFEAFGLGVFNELPNAFGLAERGAGIGGTEGAQGFADELRRARLADLEQEGLGQEYLDALQRVHSAEAKLNAGEDRLSTSDLDLAIAREGLAFAEELAGAGGERDAALRRDSSHLQRMKELIRERAERIRKFNAGGRGEDAAAQEVFDLMDKRDKLPEGSPEREDLDRQIAEKAKERGVQGRLASVTHLVNEPRKADLQAEVFDEDNGIVRTPEPTGWVRNVEVPTAADTELLPHEDTPVRVIFGTHLRPEIPGTRVPTGGKCEHVLPERITDEAESVYYAAFQRVGRDVRPVERKDAPPDETLAKEERDLVERIPLRGETNRKQLDERARQIALEHVQEREVVEGARYTFLRPWRANPNGRVPAVELRLRAGVRGWETTVIVGAVGLFNDVNKTHERPRVRQPAPPRRAEDP